MSDSHGAASELELLNVRKGESLEQPGKAVVPKGQFMRRTDISPENSEIKEELDELLAKLEGVIIVPVQKASKCGKMMQCGALIQKLEATGVCAMIPYVGPYCSLVSNYTGDGMKMVEDLCLLSICESNTKTGFVIRDLSEDEKDMILTEEIVFKDPRPLYLRIGNANSGDYDILYKGVPVYQLRGHYTNDLVTFPMTVGQPSFPNVPSLCSKALAMTFCCSEPGTRIALKHSVVNQSGDIVATIPHAQYWNSEYISSCHCYKYSCGCVTKDYNPNPCCCCTCIVGIVIKTITCVYLKQMCNECCEIKQCLTSDSYVSSHLRKDTGVRYQPPTAYAGIGPTREECMEYDRFYCNEKGEGYKDPSKKFRTEMPVVNQPDSFSLGTESLCGAKVKTQCDKQCTCFEAVMVPFPGDDTLDNKHARMVHYDKSCLLTLWEMSIGLFTPPAIPSVPGVQAAVDSVAALAGPAGAGVKYVAANVSLQNYLNPYDAVTEVAEAEGVAPCFMCEDRWGDVHNSTEVKFPPTFSKDQKLMALACEVLFNQNSIFGKSVKGIRNTKA